MILGHCEEGHGHTFSSEGPLSSRTVYCAAAHFSGCDPCTPNSEPLGVLVRCAHCWAHCTPGGSDFQGGAKCQPRLPHRLGSRLQLCSSTLGGGVGRGSTPVEPEILSGWRCMYEIQIPWHRALPSNICLIADKQVSHSPSVLSAPVPVDPTASSCKPLLSLSTRP